LAGPRARRADDGPARGRRPDPRRQPARRVARLAARAREAARAGEGAPGMSDYARHEHHDFLGAAAQALADPPLQAALRRLTGTLMPGNRRGYAALADSGQLRDHAKRIKEHTLAHLDQYLEQLESSVQRAGGSVHWAADAEAARQIVLDIAAQNNCKHAVKS